MSNGFKTKEDFKLGDKVKVLKNVDGRLTKNYTGFIVETNNPFGGVGIVIVNVQFDAIDPLDIIKSPTWWIAVKNLELLEVQVIYNEEEWV